jgi:hypothetical protein
MNYLFEWIIIKVLSIEYDNNNIIERLVLQSLFKAKLS